MIRRPEDKPAIVDSHHHLWAYSKDEYGWIDEPMNAIARDFTVSDARETMEPEGVVGTVAVQARQTVEETDWLLGLAADDDFLLGVVGWIDLESETIEQDLKKYEAADKLVGFRHVLQGEPDDRHILRPAFLEGLHALTTTGHRYDILIFERQLAGALEMMHKLPDLPCVIDHIAKPVIQSEPSAHWRTHMSAIADETSAMCKLSGMVTEADWNAWSYETFAPYLGHLFEKFGEDRLMFGSDWPVCLVAGGYPEVKAIVARFIDTYASDSAEKIWAGNAKRFYGLEVEI